MRFTESRKSTYPLKIVTYQTQTLKFHYLFSWGELKAVIWGLLQCTAWNIRCNNVRSSISTQISHGKNDFHQTLITDVRIQAMKARARHVCHVFHLCWSCICLSLCFISTGRSSECLLRRRDRVLDFILDLCLSLSSSSNFIPDRARGCLTLSDKHLILVLSCFITYIDFPLHLPLYSQPRATLLY